MRRSLAIAGILVVLLSGCSLESPKEPLETAIPAALVASDLGILEAEASTGIDGFSTYLSVFVVLDRDTLSTDELVQIVKLVVENSDNDSIGRLTVGALDGTVDGFEYIDVGAVGLRLGFSRSPVIDDVLSIGWDQALSLIEEQP